MLETESDGGDYSTTTYDAGDTTGLGGDQGDDAVHEDNWADWEYADVDPSSTVGLTDDGTAVTEENEPADVEDDTEMVGGTYDGDLEGWLDSATTEDGNSPGGNGMGAMEGNTQGAVTNAAADAAEETAEVAEGIWNFAAGAADDARDAATPDGLEWLLDNLDVVLAAAAVLGVAVVFRPYAGLADSAT